MKGVINTDTSFRESKEGLQKYANKAMIPESGIRCVKVRSTNSWVREISFLTENKQPVCQMSTGCNEGSYAEIELTEGEEIVGIFGSVDNNMHMKSFGIIVYFNEEEESY